jgi:hypothetical protein
MQERAQMPCRVSGGCSRRSVLGLEGMAIVDAQKVGVPID